MALWGSEPWPPPLDREPENVRLGHHRALDDSELAGRQGLPEMEAEDGIEPSRAPASIISFAPPGRELFGRLKEEDDFPFELAFLLGEARRRH